MKPGLRRAAAAAALFPALALLAPVLATARPWLEGPGGTAVLTAPVPYDPDAVDLDGRLSPPGRRHWLGTDDLGRDVLARLLHGARISVGSGLLAAVLALALGAFLGSAAGLSGGLADRAILSVLEVVQAFPALVLVAAAAAFLDPSLLGAALLIGVTGWTDSARLVRAETKRLRHADFVASARASGASRSRVLLRHVLPHALPPALATLPYVVGAAVLTEASLSFLGLGTPPPTASWGRALADARGSLTDAWWCVLFPALALLLLVLSVRRLGDALQSSRP